MVHRPWPADQAPQVTRTASPEWLHAARLFTAAGWRSDVVNTITWLPGGTGETYIAPWAEPP